MAFPLLALLLFAQDPAAAEPMATSTPPPAAAAPVDKDYLPQGAPADDYAFVAWCKGVLNGHMDLAVRVQSVLPMDDAQQTIGRAYLRAYDKALASSKEGKTADGKARAQAAQSDGWSKWEKARQADLQLAADTYLGWQLPGRCEHAAVRLSGDKDLFKKAFSPEELEAVRGEAPSSAVLASGGDTETANTGPVAVTPVSAPMSSAADSGVSLRPPADPLAGSFALSTASAPATEADSLAAAVTTSTPKSDFAPAPQMASAPADIGGKPIDEAAAAAETAKVEKAAAIETLPEPAKPAAAKPAPAKVEPVKKKPAPKAEEEKQSGMPKKGHLLPGFLRKKEG